MEEGDLILNWQNKPTGVYLGDNIIYWFKSKIYTTTMR